MALSPDLSFLTPDALQDDEPKRLAALQSYNILGSPPERMFDDLIDLARLIVDVPIAYISLIDSDRQWFKTAQGLEVQETPRDIAFCDHAIRKKDVMVVLDAHQDPRFRDSPLVTGPPYIRFYAGAPIITPDGYAVGTICLSDTKPHPDFSGTEELAALARQAAALLELRRSLSQQAVAARMATDQRDRLWDNSLDMMLISRPDGQIIAGNPAWEATFGPIGDNGGANFVDFLAPSEERIPPPMVNGQKDIQVEHEMVNQNGETVYASWNLAREDDMIFGIARDITRAREAEAQLVHVQRMESVGQLTGGIAHDFNNLLTIVLGNLDIAERRLGKDETQRALAAITNARGGANRAANLTQRLLAFARRQSLSPVQINAGELLDGLMPLARQALHGGIKLTLQIAETLPSICIDPGQLENAILNLIVNARDAMVENDQQTGEIALHANEYHLSQEDAETVSANASAGHWLRLCVSDNGSGIEPDIAERIFEPFFTTKPSGKGTGLGLSQVHGFIAQSGGFVTLKTEIGSGTTISLWLPVDEGEAQSVERQSDSTNDNAPAVSQQQSHHILLVEDNEAVRAHVAELLEEEGYDVISLVDGQAAVEHLQSQARKPDLLLSDIMMPNLDGHGLASWVHDYYGDVPIILMTGYAGGEMPSDSPHEALITKPFSPQDLLDAIGNALQPVKAKAAV
ncbi:GAF domain-containing hybrid sensor histidine kinase/response regulator [Alterisphingorhabdus coralli]|uniref:histidine kinase n=1 Tax=Alterisphingorhabdus coralli TaxID=3071408 RepID=A0AA97I139_9SPHN|nr:ATP-binding protein [Parasphingorhabdus sp. SCSIO 66989]WOE75662.1 ATP-binding protein [Parasphingorhabdus sp. SCSIO 66989]